MSRFLKLKDLAPSTLLSSLVLCDDLEQRDILSKLPTCVLEEVMKNIDELNLDADVFKLLYLSFNICELITQRKFTARDILYCSYVIAKSLDIVDIYRIKS